MWRKVCTKPGHLVYIMANAKSWGLRNLYEDETSTETTLNIGVFWNPAPGLTNMDQAIQPNNLMPEELLWHN